MSSGNNYCRMCIKRDDNRDFLPLSGENAHLKQKFEVCFSIPLHPTQTHVLCPRCADKLTEIAMIFMMVKDSDVFFKQLSIPPATQRSSKENHDFIPLEQTRYQNPSSRSINDYEVQRFNRERDFYSAIQKIPQLMTPSHSYQQGNAQDPPVYRPRHHPEYHPGPGYAQSHQQMNRRERESKPYHNPRGNFRPYHHHQGPSRSNNFGPPNQYQGGNQRFPNPAAFFNQNSGRDDNYGNNYSNPRGGDLNDSIEISDSDDAGDINENGGKRFACTLCDMEFDCGIKRKYHYMEVHPDYKRFQCPNCDDTFQFKKGLKLHMQLFDHMRCNICQMLFDNLSTLETHARGCKPLLFPCSYCPKRFTSSKGRHDHSRSVHNQ